MPVLVWKHGTTKQEARTFIKAEPRKLGHDGRVTWEEFTATACVGPLGIILDAAGQIPEEDLRLERWGVLSAVWSYERAARSWPSGSPAGSPADSWSLATE
jgi:hypothetical protein